MKVVVVVLALLVVSSLASAFTFDKNVPQAIQQQMLQDLSFINTIQGAGQSAIHQQIYGRVNGADYTHFFDSRVTAVGISSCGDSKAVACVIPMFNPSKMWITQNYIKFSHPQIARLMVVFHEARHTESEHDNWPHATCPDPFVDQNGQPINSIWTGASLGGEPACDITPYGSYGSSTLMLKNIQKFCSNCTDKVKQDAGIYADDQFKRIIDPAAKAAMEKDIFDALEMYHPVAFRQ